MRQTSISWVVWSLEGFIFCAAIEPFLNLFCSTLWNKQAFVIEVHTIFCISWIQIHQKDNFEMGFFLSFCLYVFIIPISLYFHFLNLTLCLSSDRRPRRQNYNKISHGLEMVDRRSRFRHQGIQVRIKPWQFLLNRLKWRKWPIFKSAHVLDSNCVLWGLFHRTSFFVIYDKMAVNYRILAIYEQIYGQNLAVTTNS